MKKGQYHSISINNYMPARTEMCHTKCQVCVVGMQNLFIKWLLVTDDPWWVFIHY